MGWRNGVENGAVFTVNTDTGAKTFYWVLCGCCGKPTTPAYKMREVYRSKREYGADGRPVTRSVRVEEPVWDFVNPGGYWRRAWMECSVCGTWAVSKAITDRCATARKPRSEKCGGACLNGKTSCDCRCRGRCHGAGECHCGEVAA